MTRIPNKNASDRFDRREFTKLALASSLAGAVPASVYAAKRPLEPLSPGIKLSLQVRTDPSDEDLQFAQQLGVEYINIPSGGDKSTAENFIRWKQRAEGKGLKVWNIGNSNVHNMRR